MTIRRPLDGFLVLDLGQIYNGPYAGLQLSFMGRARTSRRRATSAPLQARKAEPYRSC